MVCLYCEITDVYQDRDPDGLCVSCAHNLACGNLCVMAVDGNVTICDPASPLSARPYYPHVLYARQIESAPLSLCIADYYRDRLYRCDRRQEAKILLKYLAARGYVFSCKGRAIVIDNPAGLGDNILGKWESYRTEIEDLCDGNLSPLQESSGEASARVVLELLLHSGGKGTLPLNLEVR